MNLQFNTLEYFVVRQKAERAGIKVSAYIRQTAIAGVVINRLSEEERHFVRQIIGMSNNLNQLAKNSYKEGMLRAVLSFEGYRNRFDELLNKINHVE